MQIENKNYKDSVFKLLFNNKIHLLELYNALNSTSYSDPNDLEITTLEGYTLMNVKNDVSFVLDFELNLYEHQSTICPNIPLRDLHYLSELLFKLIPRKSIYSSSPVQIPNPRFLVFYNGTTPTEDKITYNLSDLFARHTDTPSVELIVTAYNINYGHNKALLDACNSLKGYSIFVSKVRKYRKELENKYDSNNPVPLNNLVDKREILKGLIFSAVSKTIDECIQEDILKEFFLTYRKEVIAMSWFSECTAEEQLQAVAEDNYDNGYRSGYDKGSEQIRDLFSWLLSEGRIEDAQKASSDTDFMNLILKEYDSCHTS